MWSVCVRLRRAVGAALTGLLLGTALVVPEAVAGAATAPFGAPAGTWTHPGYGPGNTGYNRGESKVNASTIAKLKLRWRVNPASGTDGCQSVTTPVVADNRMFIVDGDGVGSYDVRTGRALWRDVDVMSERVHRTMTLVGGLVVTTGYSCYGVSNPSGHIVALNARTGKVRWHVIEGSATERVVADKGMLVSYSVCDVCSSNSVAGYRASDGEPRWSREEVILASPVSARGRLLLTGADAGSLAVDVLTGDVLWHSTARWSVLAASPAGDRFYASDPAGALVAINASTGRALWSVPGAAGTLAADGRRVYVSRRGITAFDARTGRKLWRRKAVPDSRPIRAGGLLYVAGGVLSPASGALVLPATYSSTAQHAVVVGGRVLRVKPTQIQAYTP